MGKLELEDMLSGKKSKYSLVLAVAKRARVIADKAEINKTKLKEKPVKLAIEDFEKGRYEIFEPEYENQN